MSFAAHNYYPVSRVCAKPALFHCAALSTKQLRRIYFPNPYLAYILCLEQNQILQTGNLPIFLCIFTIGFFRIYQGEVTSIEASIASTVHISLVISSALLSQRGFLGLVIVSTIADLYRSLSADISLIANSSEQLSQHGPHGEIVFSIGMILYSIQIFRAYLDREKLKSKPTSTVNSKM